MKTVMDSAGRIVIPKSIRQALGFRPGEPLELRAGNGRLEVEIAPSAVRLQKRGKSVVAVPDLPLPVLTAAEVRDEIERGRR